MSSALAPDAKVILLTSEGGSIGLRTEGEGGGMFGHHGSKAAANMVGHLLSYDLKERGIPIAMIHVSAARACGRAELIDSLVSSRLVSAVLSLCCRPPSGSTADAALMILSRSTPLTPQR